MRSLAFSLAIFAPLTALLLTSGCKRGSVDGGVDRLSGGGATFVDPIMQRWSSEYKTAKNVEVDYKKSGSGNGIQQMSGKVLDFGCTDAPMNKDETENAKTEGGEVVHVPVIMGAVAIIYNVPGVKEQLKLNGDVIAKIYLGEITLWNDPAIAALNPGVKLPASGLTPVYRSESSGTTSIFTEFLSKSSVSFKTKIGISKNPKWPKIGTGQNGNDGIAGHVQRNEGCIGYVELYYAKKSEMPYAILKNRRGKDVLPDTENVAAAAKGAMSETPTKEPYTVHSLTYSLTDIDADTAYPICGMSYAVLFKNQPAGKGKALVDFLKWATTDGQKFAKELEYSPLPTELQTKIAARLDEVKLD
ncbi:phosphate ABC transporter substrate-binding protein PstS [Zavarzinella formosa]|uniref:phosphate ABC transporter substrate-binding protein PstS n=1 Tax=Zavarzinella formosa TaxID=360055 RepID=UPI00030D3C97|nr:phosphate ABC transporter substrate-binding protein PstS [Zavarzinella formosa]